MRDLYIARLTEQRIPYGPITGQRDAGRFAAFLSAEVDPAEVERLRDPLGEILAWQSQAASPVPEPEIIGYKVGTLGVFHPDDVTVVRRDDPVGRLDVSAVNADGHTAGCQRTDLHFYPKQCRP